MCECWGYRRFVETTTSCWMWSPFILCVFVDVADVSLIIVLLFTLCVDQYTAGAGVYPIMLDSMLAQML